MKTLKRIEKELKNTQKEELYFLGKTRKQKKEEARNLIDLYLHEITSKRRAIPFIKTYLATIFYLMRHFGLKKEYSEQVKDAVKYFCVKIDLLGA